MPSIWQIWVTGRRRSWLSAIAAARLLSSRPLGRPPFLPLARAATSPACVLSRMMSRSNSASAAKMWKMSLPPLVVVSRLSAGS